MRKYAGLPRNIPTLITGGSGFLAKILVRKLIVGGVEPKNITLFARDEGKLLDAAQETGARIITGDVVDWPSVLRAMQGQEQIFHTAAFKHLPLAEEQSEECVRSNVIGSLNVLRASIATQPKFVIGISTDKAYDPVNCYGMTKRLMEYMFAQYERANVNKTTKYRIVRYGNVLGSTGSVLQVWKKARELQQPITVTDPDMTRYFFTVEEAVEAIFVCLAHSTDAEPYIPDMRSVRMGDLAEVVAQGHPIKIIGRRPGEKAHEQLTQDNLSDTAPRMSQEDIRRELRKMNIL